MQLIALQKQLHFYTRNAKITKNTKYHYLLYLCRNQQDWLAKKIMLEWFTKK